MTKQHPIIPPLDLVREWQRDANHNEAMFPQVATRAAQWGANQELKACCEYIRQNWGDVEANAVRFARRPKPPSLKEHAIAILNVIDDELDAIHYDVLRRALEALPDD